MEGEGKNQLIFCILIFKALMFGENVHIILLRKKKQVMKQYITEEYDLKKNVTQSHTHIHTMHTSWHHRSTSTKWVTLNVQIRGLVSPRVCFLLPGISTLEEPSSLFWLPIWEGPLELATQLVHCSNSAVSATIIFSNSFHSWWLCLRDFQKDPLRSQC